jgi:hypothetical protein
MGIYHPWHKEFTKDKASVNQFSCFKKGQRHTFLSRRLHFREIFGIVVESYQHQHFLQYKQSRFVKNYNKFVVFFTSSARVQPRPSVNKD